MLLCTSDDAPAMTVSVIGHQSLEPTAVICELLATLQKTTAEDPEMYESPRKWQTRQPCFPIQLKFGFAEAPVTLRCATTAVVLSTCASRI